MFCCYNKHDRELEKHFDVLSKVHPFCDITVKQLLMGNGPITYYYLQVCPSCNGTGSTDCKEYPRCKKCNCAYCTRCKGRGKNIPKKLICKQCKGYGYIDKIVEYNTEMIDNHAKVKTFRNNNDYVRLPVKEDTENHFKWCYENTRIRPYLLHTCFITPEEAQNGFTRDIDIYGLYTIPINVNTPVANGCMYNTNHQIIIKGCTRSFVVKFIISDGSNLTPFEPVKR